MSSLLDQLSQPEVWEKFYAYKSSLACPKDLQGQLRDFIDARDYLPVCERIRKGASFPLPRKSIISKLSSQKKRVVYTYPPAENMVLKLLTYLMLRKYDSLFCDGLYSFRSGKSAKSAIHRLQRIPHLSQKYSYKVDVSNYFNSIPVERLLRKLSTATAEDPELYAFLRSLLEEPCVLAPSRHGANETGTHDTGVHDTGTHGTGTHDTGTHDTGFQTEATLLREQKGIMAGTPLASFYANLYLNDLDRFFYDKAIPYLRYSDDILVLGDSMEEVQKYAETIRSFLQENGLAVNPSKEDFRKPDQGFVFLGFFLKENTIDIAPASLTKVKQKMRRKARALRRWQKRNGLKGEKSAKAFIRLFNRKLLESSNDSDLTWSYWYFSVINTTESLHVLDLYAQDCIRFLMTGTHTKARYNARYDDLKHLGYKSLVHEYYSGEWHG